MKIKLKIFKKGLAIYLFIVYNNQAVGENNTVKTKYRGVEQLVARRAHNPKVVGSSPTPATKK